MFFVTFQIVILVVADPANVVLEYINYFSLRGMKRIVYVLFTDIPNIHKTNHKKKIPTN